MLEFNFQQQQQQFLYTCVNKPSLNIFIFSSIEKSVCICIACMQRGDIYIQVAHRFSSKEKKLDRAAGHPATKWPKRSRQKINCKYAHAM